MDDVAIARALHLLAAIHWIGGVSLVTAAILPGVARFSEPSRRRVEANDVKDILADVDVH